MLLKKMINLCKKANKIEVLTAGDTVFFGDGSVYGAFEKGDVLTADEIMCFMELPDDKREAMQRISTEVAPPYADEPIARGRYSLNCAGTALQAFTSISGALFADSGHISIFNDCPTKKYKLGTFADRMMIMVLRDNSIIGMIEPVRLDLEEMYSFCSALAAEVRRAKENNFFIGGMHQYSLTDE